MIMGLALKWRKYKLRNEFPSIPYIFLFGATVEFSPPNQLKCQHYSLDRSPLYGAGREQSSND